MKRNFVILSLIFIFILLVGCENNNTNNNQSNKENNDKSFLDEISLSEHGNNSEYSSVLDLNILNKDYYISYITTKSFTDTQIVITQNSEFSLINDSEVANALKEKYTNDFFKNKALVIIPDIYAEQISEIFYKNGYIIILPNSLTPDIPYTYIIEVDYSKFDINKIYNTSSNEDNYKYSSQLLKNYVLNSNIITYDSYCDIVFNTNNDSIIYNFEINSIFTNEYTKHETINVKYNNKELIITNDNRLNELSIAMYTNYIKIEKINNPDYLYEFTFKNKTYKIINPSNFDIYIDDKWEGTYLCLNGNFTQLLFDIVKEKSKDNSLLTKLCNLIVSSSQYSLLDNNSLNTLIKLLFDINEWDTPEAFEYSFFDQLDYYQTDSERKDIKNLVNQFQVLLKNVKDTYFNANYKIENGILDSNPINVVNGENYKLVAPKENGKLFCGFIFQNSIYFDLEGIYNFNRDIVIEPLYLNADYFTIEKIENINTITSINNYTNDSLYIPIYDSNDNLIEAIGENVINNQITNLYINNYIKTINDKAFKDQSKLTNIYIGSSVNCIKESTFENCTSLKNIIINEGVTNLGQNTFYNCTSLEYIYLPSSIDNLGDKVFSGCDSLEEFEINQDNKLFIVSNNCIMEGTTLYYGCKASTIPEGTVFIREAAFYLCRSLEYIYIPSSVVHIDQYAFRYCTGLKEVYISQSVMYLAGYAFSTDTTTVINCEYLEKMSGWTKNWYTGDNITVNWSVPQPIK